MNKLCNNDIIENYLDDINEFGLRNSQLTVLAPTGTISFVMDCDGLERPP